MRDLPGHAQPLRCLLIADEADILALSYREQGHYVEAEQLLKRSLMLRKQALGPEHPAVALSLENYASQLRDTRRDAKAARLEARARAIHAKNAEADLSRLKQEVVGGEPMNDRTEAIKRRAAEIAAEIAAETAEIEEDMRSAIFDLGMQNLAAFRKKLDAAGITQILQETPRIKVYDHDYAYGFRLGKMEYAVFADWDSGGLCRDVSLEESTRRPRITDFDHDDALNEMVDCLARMLATIEAGGAL